MISEYTSANSLKHGYELPLGYVVGNNLNMVSVSPQWILVTALGFDAETHNILVRSGFVTVADLLPELTFTKLREVERLGQNRAK